MKYSLLTLFGVITTISALFAILRVCYTFGFLLPVVGTILILIATFPVCIHELSKRRQWHTPRFGLMLVGMLATADLLGGLLLVIEFLGFSD